MQSKEVCHLLGITKVTLNKYQKDGRLKGTKLPNGYWNWDNDSVYADFTQGNPGKIYELIQEV